MNTEERRNEVAKRFATEDTRALAKELGVHWNTIYADARLLGVKKPEPLSYAEKVAALSMRLRRVGIYKIARQLGTSTVTLNKLFDRTGLSRRMDYWPEHEIYEVILKCSTYTEFMDDHAAAYQAARKKGMLAEIKRKFDE